ncbi:MAG: hypothetical protein ACJAU0_002363 [Flavobacteriales bacterium]|jgi:hypothetical protein
MLDNKNKKVGGTYKSETTLDSESSQLNQIIRKSKLPYHYSATAVPNLLNITKIEKILKGRSEITL